MEKRREQGTGSDAQRVKSSGVVEEDRGQGRAVRSEGQLLAARAPGEWREEAVFVRSDCEDDASHSRKRKESRGLWSFSSSHEDTEGDAGAGIDRRRGCCEAA